MRFSIALNAYSYFNHPLPEWDIALHSVYLDAKEYGHVFDVIVERQFIKSITWLRHKCEKARVRYIFYFIMQGPVS